jgi:very-short-patch-repair endonuclease
MAPSEILRERARHLRKNMSDAEKRLWYYLGGRRLGNYKFKRQEPIGNYIVDFVCHWKKLIIELDGGQHALTQNYDEKRTAELSTKGYSILRFWNSEVLMEIETVLGIIMNALQST